jgi:RNA polymerase sigma-70 factor, ECF subfamily
MDSRCITLGANIRRPQPVLMLSMDKELSSEDFAALYSAHHLDLLRYVLTLLPDRSQAEDVVQEIARLLWQKRGEYSPAKPFLPWARGFARFEVLTVLRRQAVRGKYFSEELVEQLAEERAAHEDRLSAQRQALASCLQKLDEPSRELLMLRYGREMTVQQLAHERGKSANALYLAIHRIRATLTDCVNRTLRIEGWI